MELRFARKDKIVGVFMIFVLGLMLASIVLVGRGKDWFKTYVTYYTVFKETYGLQEGASVKLYNAEIGKVRRIVLVEDEVQIRLAILEDYASRIKTDTVATVESPTFIGSEFVAIKPGSPQAHPIPRGGTIPSEAKKSVGDILEEYQVEETAKRLTLAIQDLSDIVEELRNPDGPLFTAMKRINASLADIQSVTADIRAGKGTVGELVKSDALIKKVYAELETLDSILKRMDETAAKTPEMAESVRESLEKVNRILDNLEKGSEDVPAIVKSSKRGVEEIREGVGDTKRLIKAVEKLPLVRDNLPPKAEGKNMDAGLRK